MQNGVYWCCMETALAKTELIRRSISLPQEIAERVDEIAATRHVSANRAMIDLLRDAIAAYDQRKKVFLDLADRFQKSTDPSETEKLRDELARITFGG